MNGEDQSGNNGFLEKIGLSVDAFVNNSVVEFFVERYVNWTTEAQRRFRHLAGLFLLLTAMAVVVLVYLTTYAQHKDIEVHNTVLQMLKKYSVKKARQEEQLDRVQAGRGGIVQGFGRSNIMQILGTHSISSEGVSISRLSRDKKPGFVTQSFEINVPSMTYPQMVHFLFEIESRWKNVVVSQMKVSKEGKQRGYYGLLMKLSVTEPAAAGAR